MVATLEHEGVYSLKQLENHRMTDDEFYEFCLLNDQIKFERDAFGKIIIMPNTGGITGIKNSDLIIDLGNWNRKNKLGQIFDSSTAFRLPSSAVRSPDVAWVSNERWNTLTYEEQTKFPPLCPEFLIELMSESDDLKQAIEKMHKWIDNGCQLAWLIFPKGEEVRIFRANGTIDLIYGFDNVLSGENVLPNLEFDLTFLKSTN
jgi:Uma2 family endonuclease